MAALLVDPLHASIRHQALHHFVARAEWSDAEMLRRVAHWVVSKMDFAAGGFWIIEDTALPKKGKHSWGWRGNTAACWASRTTARWRSVSPWPTSRPACRWPIGCNCRMEWAQDPARRHKAGVPSEVQIATKTEFALAQLQALLAERAPGTACWPMPATGSRRRCAAV